MSTTHELRSTAAPLAHHGSRNTRGIDLERSETVLGSSSCHALGTREVAHGGETALQTPWRVANGVGGTGVRTPGGCVNPKTRSAYSELRAPAVIRYGEPHSQWKESGLINE
jgi:hypothetical protein